MPSIRVSGYWASDGMNKLLPVRHCARVVLQHLKLQYVQLLCLTMWGTQCEQEGYLKPVNITLAI